MSFMIWIIEEIIAIQEFFYDAYLEVRDWVWPFYLLSYPLYGLYGSFYWLEEGFYEFYQWLLWAGERLEETFSWPYIRSLISSWLYGIESALEWFGNWAYWVREEINEWWQPILLYVLGYIDLAVEGLANLVTTWDYFWNVTWPGLLDELVILKATWDNFWSVTFPTLVNFDWLNIWWNSRLQEVDTLISSWLTSFSPFWEGWQEVRQELGDFFTDPLQWAYDKLDEFFERFW